jgi:glycosyltransferase involved in cell wall biosynthesis
MAVPPPCSDSNRIAIRFCPPVPTWGSPRTYAEQFLPKLLKHLPNALCYSTIQGKVSAGVEWLPARNYLHEPGVLRKLSSFLFENILFERRLIREGVKTLFCPFNNDGLIFPRRVRQVLIVHDLVPLQFPKEYPATRILWGSLFRMSVRRSKKIICVSDATRRELIRRLNINPDNIETVYNGYDATEEISVCQRLPRALYVASAHGAHKNIPTLLHAFSVSRLRNSHELRIVGVPNRRNTPLIRRLIVKLGLQNKVRLLTHLSKEDLISEYRLASLFVYPSLCEGFGLPLLEAMTYGVPVCASNTSAMPEIAGSAALYFNPIDPIDIARVMERMNDDILLQRELVNNGYTNLKRFSWEQSAMACAKICKNI